MSVENFHITDYFIFLLTLFTSMCIGIYFGCFQKQQKTTKVYLFGRKKLKYLPVALSIYSSSVTAIGMIGTPVEVYTFGFQFIISNIGIMFAVILIWKFVLPVICGKLQMNNPYEYFELRFNFKVRFLASMIYILQTFIYMPVMMYATIATFSADTKIPITLCSICIGGVCIIYTMLGGFTAVVWTDALQVTIMFTCLILILIKGIVNIGSFSEVWHRAEQGQRLNIFEMDPSPLRRMTFWSVILGNIFLFLNISCTAGGIQRYMSIGNERNAKKSSIIHLLCSIFHNFVLCFIGITMFAQYYGCDPVKNNEVSSAKELYFVYIRSLVKDYPGFAGLFNAGLISAGLSTLSAELNTVSGLIYYNIIKKIYKKPIKEVTATFILKIIILFNGIFYVTLTPLMSKIKFLFIVRNPYHKQYSPAIKLK